MAGPQWYQLMSLRRSWGDGRTKVPTWYYGCGCLVPCDLWSFGLGGLPTTKLLACWSLPCPFGPLRVESLGQGSLPAACSLKLNFSVVLAACCNLNPGCQDLGLFCRSFLRGILNSSDQASVPSDALVEPRLDSLLMSRRRALGSGLCGSSSLRWFFFPWGDTRRFIALALEMLWLCCFTL